MTTNEDFELCRNTIIAETEVEIKSLKGELPADFDPTGYVPQLLAQIRHEYTTYEGSLQSMYYNGPVCMSDVENVCPYETHNDIGGYECKIKRLQYQNLKDAANDLGMRLLEDAKKGKAKP